MKTLECSNLFPPLYLFTSEYCDVRETLADFEILASYMESRDAFFFRISAACVLPFKLRSKGTYRSTRVFSAALINSTFFCRVR
jgi:hypothetical protein